MSRQYEIKNVRNMKTSIIWYNAQKSYQIHQFFKEDLCAMI